MGIGESDPCSKLSLPPGFRFYPTDEELVVQYLCRKVAGHHFSLEIIGDVDLYKFDAWDLPKKALFGEKEWYFFSPRDRKYPNGSRPNRMAGSGYWKATGTDKTITVDGIKVGIKKALVFYVGKAPKGTKTNWIMHEYRLCQSPRKKESTRFADCVLCRIYEKNSIGLKPEVSGSASPCSSQYDEVMETLPETGDGFSSSSSKMSTLKNSDGEEDQKMNLDWTTLAGLSPNWPEVSQAQNTGWRNDVYVPTPVGDVLSGSEFFPQDVRGFGFGFGQSYSGLVDPFEVPYPNLPGRLGFRQ